MEETGEKLNREAVAKVSALGSIRISRGVHPHLTIPTFMLLLNTQRKPSFFWTTSINKMGNKGAGGGVGGSVHDADVQGALT